MSKSIKHPSRVNYEDRVKMFKERLRRGNLSDLQIDAIARHCCQTGVGLHQAKVFDYMLKERAPMDRRRFEHAPCYICGYNGPGYFQPATHKCAKQFHDEGGLI